MIFLNNLKTIMLNFEQSHFHRYQSTAIFCHLKWFFMSNLQVWYSNNVWEDSINPIFELFAVIAKLGQKWNQKNFVSTSVLFLVTDFSSAKTNRSCKLIRGFQPLLAREVERAQLFRAGYELGLVEFALETASSPGFYLKSRAYFEFFGSKACPTLKIWS